MKYYGLSEDEAEHLQSKWRYTAFTRNKEAPAISIAAYGPPDKEMEELKHNIENA